MKFHNAQDSRVISAAEVKDWFGTSDAAKLAEHQYREIAVALTRCRWPCDPPAPLPAPANSRPRSFPNFHEAAKAAKTLSDCLPAILEYWEGQRAFPQVLAGRSTTATLQQAVAAAMYSLEWPFGEYERLTGVKTPKPWHTMAQVIARLIIGEMVKAGHENPGISRNSVVVRVVHRTLIRMDFPHREMITLAAIAAYLTRWNDKYGLTPHVIAALSAQAASSMTTK